MTDLNIGRRIVEYVLQTGDLQPFLDAGLTLAWLKDKKNVTAYAVFAGADAQAYELILRHWDEHDSAPTLAQFRDDMPAYRPKPSEFLASELIARANGQIKAAIVGQILDDMVNLDREGRYDAALLRLQEASDALSVPLADLSEEMAIQERVRNLRQHKEAQRRLDNAEQDRQPLRLLTGPQIAKLESELSWRVEQIIGAGSNVLISAQAKVGKTTFIINLLRSLVTGVPFLSAYGVTEAKSVTVVDTEMSGPMIKDWLGKAGILHRDGFRYCFLGGRARDLEVLDDRRRARTAAALAGTDVLVIDPLGPLMAANAIDENSNTDVRRLLSALHSLKNECGASELIIVHHSGHAALGRTRGASVLLDWPDSFISLAFNPNNPDGPRDIMFRGRNITEPRNQVTMGQGILLTTSAYRPAPAVIQPADPEQLGRALRNNIDLLARAMLKEGTHHVKDFEALDGTTRQNWEKKLRRWGGSPSNYIWKINRS